MINKICILTSVHPPFDVRIFHKEAISLAKAGYNVTLIAQHNRDEIVDGIRIVSLLKPNNRIMRITLTVWQTYLKALNVDAEIYHFHDPELMPIALLLKWHGKTVLYDVHEDLPRQILSKHWIPPLLRKTVSAAIEIFENFVAKRLDAVVCATPFIEKRFKRLNKMSINVNNYPIKEEFQPTSKKKPFSRTICYVGDITRMRGIIELLKALEILRDVRLIICGPFESRLFADELKSMEGWKFVEYKGIVERDEVHRILTCSTIGVVTLLPIPNYIYSQPTKMFEYMSAGLPVIASDFPLWRRIIEEAKCGLCVNPSSPQDIAHAIASLLSNEIYCYAKGNAGRKAILSQFNWMNESAKLLTLYESMK